MPPPSLSYLFTNTAAIVYTDLVRLVQTPGMDDESYDCAITLLQEAATYLLDFTKSGEYQPGLLSDLANTAIKDVTQRLDENNTLTFHTRHTVLH